MKKILFLITILFLLALSSVNFVSAAGNTSNDNYQIDVTHDEIKRDTNTTFNITVKNKDSSVASGANITVFITHINSADFSLSRASLTDSKGKYSFQWETGNVEDLGLYELKITVHNQSDVSYRTVYTEYMNLTITHTLDVQGPKSLYKGEFAEIKVYSWVDGKKNSLGYIQWTIDGKNYLTNFNNGVSVLNYNSYNAGVNQIYIKYIPMDFPGFEDIPVVTKTFTVNIKNAYAPGSTLNPGPDLVIAKVLRSGNNYKVTVKNIGTVKSTKTKLKMWYSSKKYKIINVAALGAGQSKTYIIKFFKYNTHKKYKKYVHINYNKASYESNHTNNKLGFKSNVAYGLAADLKVTKVVRKGNDYAITIKNQGNLAASPFMIKFWFGSKTKGKGIVSDTIKKFGQFGNKLPPGVSVTLNIPYYPYKTHSKYYKFIQVNSNKKLPELNYNNNIKKFKI